MPSDSLQITCHEAWLILYKSTLFLIFISFGFHNSSQVRSQYLEMINDFSKDTDNESQSWTDMGHVAFSFYAVLCIMIYRERGVCVCVCVCVCVRVCLCSVGAETKGNVEGRAVGPIFLSNGDSWQCAELSNQWLSHSMLEPRASWSHRAPFRIVKNTLYVTSLVRCREEFPNRGNIKHPDVFLLISRDFRKTLNIKYGLFFG